MSAYKGPIFTAILTFPFLAFLISFVLIVYEYRKYGTFLFTRALILYSFVFYLLCAYFLIILPLPPRAEVAHYTSQIIELRPFYTLVRFSKETVLNLHNPSTYLPALKQGVVLEPVFNILLLVPFGVYLRYYFKFSFKKVVAASFCLSLFFELTQLSGLYFIYPRPYRLADVNDLMNNTLGGIIGYALAPVITFLLPARSELDEVSYEKGRQVSFFRRLVAFLFDWFFINIFQTILTIMLRLNSSYRAWDDKVNFSNSGFWFFVSVFLVFMLLPFLTNGQTLGKKIVKIRLEEEGKKRISFKALVIRYGSLYYLFGVLTFFMQITGNQLNSYNRWLQLVCFFLFLFAIFLQLLLLVNLLYSSIRKKRLFYEKASHTYTASTVQEEK